jgi:hypothetical protein
MDITNETGTDTRYTVKRSGGSGMAPHHRHFPFRSEEAVHWEILPPGSVVVRHASESRGPWQVYFFVEGQGVTAEARSDNDRISLVASDGSFKAEVRKSASNKLRARAT